MKLQHASEDTFKKSMGRFSDTNVVDVYYNHHVNDMSSVSRFCAQICLTMFALLIPLYLLLFGNSQIKQLEMVKML